RIEFLGVNGGINWTTGRVMATGVGVPPARAKYRAKKHALACRAAVTDAQRNLLETTKGVRIQSATLVKDFMVESDLVRSTVKGVVKGAHVMAKSLEADGSCHVTMAIPLSGDLASQLYGHALNKRGAWWKAPEWLINMGDVARSFTIIPDLIPSAEAKPVAVDANWKAELGKINRRLDKLEKVLKMDPARVAQGVSRGPATGLIIDARGSNFIPSMSPKVRQLRGGIVYPNIKQQHEAKNNGRLISLFMKDLLLAQGHPRVGDRPLVMKALRTFGKTRTELVLGKESSKKLTKMISKGFLDHASVIVVMD
ncbi:MAG: hypothetical protein R8K22_06000, partial [Mariprofundaceae bacterium]